MCAGYHAAGDEENPFAELDEFLCEYVDGTMDPAVRRAFEEYVLSEPALAEHVAQLIETRQLLCQYGHQVHAPCWLQTRLHQQLSIEMLDAQAPVLSNMVPRLSAAVALSSLVVLLVLASVLVIPESELAAAGEATEFIEEDRAPRAYQAGMFSGGWTFPADQPRMERLIGLEQQSLKDSAFMLMAAEPATVRRISTRP